MSLRGTLVLLTIVGAVGFCFVKFGLAAVIFGGLLGGSVIFAVVIAFFGILHEAKHGRPTDHWSQRAQRASEDRVMRSSGSGGSTGGGRGSPVTRDDSFIDV